MDIPPSIQLDRPRRRRKRKAVVTTPTPPPVTGPVLVAATFDSPELVVTLTFDRDVDGYNVVAEAVTVFDGSAVTEYRSSTDVLQPDPQTVQILMLEFGEFTGSGQHMTAVAGNGIVAQGSGEPWAGVSNLGLPFP